MECSSGSGHPLGAGCVFTLIIPQWFPSAQYRVATFLGWVWMREPLSRNCDVMCVH